MSMNDILDAVRRFDGVLELAPTPGSEYPEVAWGDHFLYFAPDGEVPRGSSPTRRSSRRTTPTTPCHD